MLHQPRRVQPLHLLPLPLHCCRHIVAAAAAALLLQELDEVLAENERLAEEHASLQATFKALKDRVEGIMDQQDTLLQANTANSTALQEKLAAAEVGGGMVGVGAVCSAGNGLTCCWPLW